MQKNYVAKTTVNFPDFELYVRIGDVLVYNAANGNNLTIYRGGNLVKTIKTSPISLAAMVKTKLLVEVTAASSKPVISKTPVKIVKPRLISKKEIKAETTPVPVTLPPLENSLEK
jgi:hypothetical protein